LAPRTRTVRLRALEWQDYHAADLEGRHDQKQVGDVVPARKVFDEGETYGPVDEAF
jgi:hypothetical protein